MDIKIKLLTVSLVASMVSACSGSGGSNVRGSSSDPGNGGDPENQVSSTFIEEAVEDTGDVTGELGNTIEILGATISQTDIPLVGTVTDGAGNVITHVGEGVGTLSAGLVNGLGNISENDNAIGTTVGGVTGFVSETGEVVSEAGKTVESLNTLPVLAQLDEASGVLTTVGGTVDSLGLKVTDLGNYLTLTFVGEDGLASELTTELTAVVRPLIINVDGVVKNVGQAIVITPVVTGLVGQVGSAVVVLGEGIGQQDNVVLASAGGIVEGAGTLLVDLDGNLNIAPSESDGLGSFDLSGLLGGDNSGNLINQLLGNELLPGDTDLLGSLLSQDGDLLAGLTETLDGLTGGLLNGQGDVIGQLTGTVDSVTGGLLNGQGDVIGQVSGTLDGITGGLLNDQGDVLGQVTGTIDGVTGNLLGTDQLLTDTVGTLTGTVGGLTNGLTGTEGTGLVGGVVDTVDGVTGGLLGTTNDGTGNSGGLLNGLLGGLLNR